MIRKLKGRFLITVILTTLFMCSKGRDEASILTWFRDTPTVGCWQRTQIQQYRGEELYDIINGGATLYLDHGLSKGVRTTYNTPDGKECEVFYHVLKDRAAAQKLFVVQKKNLSRVTAIDGYGPDKVQVSKTIGATLIFGWQGRSFYELNVSGCKNFRSVVNSAEPFLTQLK